MKFRVYATFLKAIEVSLKIYNHLHFLLYKNHLKIQCCISKLMQAQEFPSHNINIFSITF